MRLHNLHDLVNKQFCLLHATSVAADFHLCNISNILRSQYCPSRREAFKRVSNVTAAIPVFEKAELSGGNELRVGRQEMRDNEEDLAINSARLSELDGIPLQQVGELSDGWK